MAINDAKDLGDALKNDADSIEIEGSLAQKVLRIKATGKIAWAIAIGAIGFGLGSTLAAPATGGTTLVAHFMTTPVAAAALGSATSTAIVIAVTAGGVGVLTKLRRYKLEKISANKVILRK